MDISLLHFLGDFSPCSQDSYGHKNDEEVDSFSQWMSYSGYDNFTDICVDFYFILDGIHDYSAYKVNGLRCSLKFSTMNIIRLFISWIATKMADDNFELYAELRMSLTRDNSIISHKKA